VRPINKIIIHCSASDLPGQDRDVIRQWHLARGFSDIGYHNLILSDGTVQQGRSLEKVGAHCEGENHDSIGICLVGLYFFKDVQYTSLRLLVKAYQLRFGPLTVHPHNEFNKGKTCPVFDVTKVLSEA